MVQEHAFTIKLNDQTKGLLKSLRSPVAAAGAIAGAAFAGGKGIVELIAQLKVFQPVINMVKGIVNMLGQFLQPIADVVILLLMPILQILKPILI
ncbi:hypothetical protein LCGC14_3126220, partial [marine sediment metagenome]